MCLFGFFIRNTEHRPVQGLRLRAFQEPQRRRHRHQTAERSRIRSFDPERGMVEAAGAELSSRLIAV